MKVVAGLGNPGPDYDDTRHNVGWWALDRLAHDWGFDGFRAEGPALVAAGPVGDHDVELLKPTTWMNRSGAALVRYESLAPAEDLLVIVDDAALEVGRLRFRPRGGTGGHNGLASISAVLGTDEYARLRVGVGRCPEGESLVDWVLSPMPPEDEDAVLELLAELPGAVRLWMDAGVDAVMNRYNR